MNKAIQLLAMAIAIYSCENSQIEINDFVYPDQLGVWKKIEVPGGDVINAICGNIDDSLVVIKDQFEIKYSTNKGKTWKQGLKQSLGLTAFSKHKDTIYAHTGNLTKTLFDNPIINRMDFGSNPGWFSTDGGIKWSVNSRRNHYDEPVPVNFVNVVESDVSFFVKDVFRIEDGEITNTIDHNVIIKKSGNSYTQVDFPIYTYVENLYIDNCHRLYVCLGYNYKFYMNEGAHIPKSKRSGIIYMTDLANL